MASFTDLAAVVEIREPSQRLWKRIKREYKRVGFWRFFDILAFRLYSRLMLASKDKQWEKRLLHSLENKYQELSASVRILQTPSPNSGETEELLRELRPDIIIARCKSILNPRIFNHARVGTFVMHPGICPEYRNAHGCFWALAQRDLDNVGMTLLKVNEGVDTGAIYGYYRCSYDEARETHNMIQNKVVFENLDAIGSTIEEIMSGTAQAIETHGRASRAWGQPWLTSYVRWKRAARKEA